MSSQTPLLPTLYSLLPPTSHLQTTARLSLQSLHVEAFIIHDTIYTSTHPVVPGQCRSLRLRARRRRRPSSSKPRKGEKTEGGEWEYGLTYLSQPLSAREYSEMSVRACVGVGVAGMSTRAEVEEFVEDLGFRYSRSGRLFHLPLPTPALMLHLTITRIRPYPPGSTESEEDEDERSSEPYLVELQPSRPVQAVASRGDVGLQDTMRIMRDTADRIDGLEWSTGR